MRAEQGHQETTENGRQQAPELSRDATRFVGQANGRRSTERDEYVVAQRRAGYTLQEIADDLGVSRERVRQLCERAGIGDLHAAGGPERLDPIAVLRYARSPECRSLKAAAAHLGVPMSSVYAMVHQLGAMGALKRLYRWRASSANRARIVERMQAWIDANGRLPTGREINDPTRTGLPCGPTIASAFGSVSAMWKAMGVTPRPSGYRGHLSHDTPARPERALAIASDRSRSIPQAVATPALTPP